MEKKKLDKGQHTSLTCEWKRHLESIGFRWAEPKGQEAWEKRYRELVEFKAKVTAVESLFFNAYILYPKLIALYVIPDWSL